MSAQGYSHGFATAEEKSARDSGRRTADVLLDVLASAGVEVIFGIPGGAIAPLNDALLDRPDIRVITTAHESGAIFAAQAYARASGKLGVVFVTSGPGILNAMTGIASAYCDGMPVLVVAGEVPRSVFGRGALQEGSAHHLDIVSTCRPITKMAMQVPMADVAPAMLQRAMATALSGRKGPVVLTLPLDVASAPIRAPRVAQDVSVAHQVDGVMMRGVIHDAAEALATARRPLIFVGSGARWGQGARRVRELAERLQCPVVTTPKAKGIFPESHPLSLGVFGYGGHPSASQYLEQGIDVILVVGSTLGDIATNGWSPLLRPTKSFVQIDLDAMNIGRNYAVTHGLVGDAGVLVGEIVHALPDEERAPQRFGVRRFTDPRELKHGAEGRITPMRALWELQGRMPDDTMYSCDIGEHLLFGTHYLQANDPHAFQVMTGLGSMGSSIASAIGARLAMPTRQSVAVCGDGCFAMMFGDLSVAVRNEIPVLVAVLDDERYGMVELGHEAIYGRAPKYPTGPSDICAMARSVGASAVAIERADHIREIDLLALLREGPLVLDIRIDRTVKMPKNSRFDDIKGATKAVVLN
ncbi:MAG TPA: thiamine pyrophosphate-binding protein [Labilithrix sp.]